MSWQIVAVWLGESEHVYVANVDGLAYRTCAVGLFVKAGLANCAVATYFPTAFTRILTYFAWQRFFLGRIATTTQWMGRINTIVISTSRRHCVFGNDNSK